MNHLCKIELIGRVGAVREQVVGNERVVRFSLAVDNVYRGMGGSSVKTTWFNCSYWGNCEIEKGKDIHLEGRMVSETYTDSDGRPSQYYEVKVNRIW